MAHYPVNAERLKRFKNFHKDLLEEVNEWLSEPLLQELFSDDDRERFRWLLVAMRATDTTLDDDLNVQGDLEVVIAWLRPKTEEAYAREQQALKECEGNIRKRARDTSKPEWVADATVEADPDVVRRRDRVITYRRLYSMLDTLSYSLKHRAEVLGHLVRRGNSSPHT